MELHLLHVPVLAHEHGVPAGQPCRPSSSRDVQVPFSSKRSLQHAKVVPLMRGTGYISTEVNRYGVSNARANKRVIKGRPMGESYKDRDGPSRGRWKTYGRRYAGTTAEPVSIPWRRCLCPLTSRYRSTRSLRSSSTPTPHPRRCRRPQAWT